jgi:hypothetical protein
MKTTRLIQRLHAPSSKGFINPFSFGGGYRNGGLSDEAMNLLVPIFSFDYMGASEFEFGELPKALQEMAKNHASYSLQTIQVAPSKKSLEKHVPSDCEVSTKKRTVWLWAPTEHMEEIQKRIKKLANSDPCGIRWKKEIEPIDLKCASLFDLAIRTTTKNSSATVGWLELDNAFFFTIDEKMAVAFAKLFEA